MRLQFWNKTIKKFFLGMLIIFMAIGVLFWLTITALLGSMSSNTKFNLLFVLSGKFNLLWAIILGFVFIILSIFLDWVFSITIYNKFWRGGYRQHIDTKDITASKLIIDDRNIISDKPRWTTKNGSIYEIDGKQTKEVMQNFNEGLQNDAHNPKSGFVIRNVWDNKAKLLNTTAASYVNASVVGDPGSGKTVSIVLPTIFYNAKLKNKSTMIINDPKGELYVNKSGKKDIL